MNTLLSLLLALRILIPYAIERQTLEDNEILQIHAPVLRESFEKCVIYKDDDATGFGSAIFFRYNKENKLTPWIMDNHVEDYIITPVNGKWTIQFYEPWLYQHFRGPDLEVHHVNHVPAYRFITVNKIEICKFNSAPTKLDKLLGNRIWVRYPQCHGKLKELPEIQVR